MNSMNTIVGVVLSVNSVKNQNYRFCVIKSGKTYIKYIIFDDAILLVSYIFVVCICVYVCVFFIIIIHLIYLILTCCVIIIYYIRLLRKHTYSYRKRRRTPNSAMYCYMWRYTTHPP